MLPSQPLCTVDFEPIGCRVQVPPGLSLMEAARQAGLALVSVCGGQGLCGRCLVRVISGPLSALSPTEQAALDEAQRAEGLRLACLARVLGDVKVDVPDTSRAAQQRLELTGAESAAGPGAFQPTVREYCLTLPRPSVQDPRSDLTLLQAALAEQAAVADQAEDRQADQAAVAGQVAVDGPIDQAAVAGQTVVDGQADQAAVAGQTERHAPAGANLPVSMDLPALARLPELLRAHDWRVRVSLRASLRGVEVIDARPPDVPPLGLAVDIGTTKVAAYLVDLENGATLAVDGMTNPQIAYGEDVMSRITFTMKEAAEPAGGRLTALIRQGLDELAGRMCAALSRDPGSIVDAVVVGNTAMHHLLLGLPARQLGLAPYTAVVSDPLDVKARDLGLHLAPGAYVHVLPNVAGFIGADHVAMVLATGLDQAQGTRLGLDIGTNTEVVLAQASPDGLQPGRLLSCSTASGPAFEGAHIQYGMRAVDGAIEQVAISVGQVQVKTIHGAPPIGLCGSGVLSAIDQLRRAGLLNRRGRLLPHPRVREGSAGREFVLVAAEHSGACRDITLSEADISEILLAKAAIRTGIDTLLREAGVGLEEVSGIVIAGAFGTRIDVRAALGIGLLPTVPPASIQQVGNAAGVGARLALVSAPLRERAVAIARRIEYLELMVQPDFASRFAHAMFLTEG